VQDQTIQQEHEKAASIMSSKRSNKILPLMIRESSVQINQKNEKLRIQQENYKIATAMIKMKPNYDLSKF
jgi:hypothetical protein